MTSFFQPQKLKKDLVKIGQDIGVSREVGPVLDEGRAEHAKFQEDATAGDEGLRQFMM